MLSSACAATGFVLLAAACGRPAHVRQSDGLSATRPGSVESARLDQYVGDAACARCHAGICKQHSGSAHAATLSFVGPRHFEALFHSRQRLTDDNLGLTYTVGVRDGRCVIKAQDEKKTYLAPAEVAVGSGRSGLTFLGHSGSGSWEVLRLSYSRILKTWDFSPSQHPNDQGFDLPTGLEIKPEEVAICLRCHVTYLRNGSDGPDLTSSHLGIGCEACHGPAKQHVDTAIAASSGRRLPIAHLPRLSANSPIEIESVCSPCHSSNSKRATINVGDVKTLARFQALALEKSRCFIESKTLSCVTCHNPHTDLVRNRTAEESICLRCHSPNTARSTDPNVHVTASVCRVNPRNGCIGCHMPAVTLSDLPSAPFHNHWIRVWNAPANRSQVGPPMPPSAQ